MLPRANILAQSDVESLLGNWERLNADLLSLPLPAVEQLLVAEASGQRRPIYIIRLYGRYNRLRSIEEKAALLRGELWPVTHDRQL